MKSEKNIKSINKLIEIIKKLRAPNGCDWDREQTHNSLIPYLIEETYEVIDAIEKNDFNSLKEELGDLLLHVIFQVQLAEESNKFVLDDVVESINKKLINRHPHIFIDKSIKSWDSGNWEKAKQKDKKRESVLDGVPNALPGLFKSRRIQEKASSVGFDWDDIDQVIKKVDEEIIELKESIKKKKGISDELGDVLFSIVNLSRHLNLNPEESLNKSTEKFIKRFKRIEKDLENENKTISELSLDTLDKLWEKNKKKFE